MTAQIEGARVLIITSNTGVEHDELTVPRDRLRELGAVVTHAAIENEPVHTFRHDLQPDETVEPDGTIAAVDPADPDLLVVPGGTVNADQLRVHEPARELVRALSAAGTPVAAICHGPWLLVDAEVLPGTTVTSYPSLRADLENAGASWVDEPVVRCEQDTWHLITSRRPGDIPDFVEAIAGLLPAHRA
ncbi:type 1 glutamine amidotransferase domain-containing protein [Nocardia stercoris]|uniref:Type 1 glutamine amidotransferase n=1 Tax=Nocardia stercoris TaxID=2483361 RepID=A0A3M2L1K4_9NOCA|nr:type 1 glutamine amidotransferase domain-containing protein [Nocardia stercoris]RMI31264.1 type 1 glutamine amidotransferase [Nocardia stercoris]